MSRTAAHRVFRQHRALLLTQEVCDTILSRLAVALAGTFAEAGPITAVIGIADGGTIPARTLAARLHAPIWQIQAKHNATDAPFTQATGTVTVSPPADLPDLDGRVLLVDDICGSGATFTAATAALTPRLAYARLETAALCRNIGAAMRPHWWGVDVDDWVIFPWEARPTGITARPVRAPERIRTA